ncbi:7dc4a4ed-46aa-43a0-a922-a0dc6b7e4eef [Thermothielavioides terrestris]|uniref:7dc4a4ed-46aa-43a0-a922-a0dc6b7e4eef n=1 Tax=Thermothielavioides terrestris TaxID=2587410 RepID=A0A446BBV9_9PEZI|nr:7dc4a4ed-46aa-43a0-a922-a0dc6b7e4eef [Thermothielavioides terrestris]
MPVPVAAKVGIVAASVAVAAAIAIYEIPEVRRAAQTVRRRIAIALHSLGENVDPDARPRFNRPEDADGFYQSHAVDADEETRRRQREELLYWNMRREEQRRRQSQGTRGSTFDDFLQPDRAAESGTYVFNTGADARAWDADNVLRRRGNAEGVRGLNAALFANPFSDEHEIQRDEHIELLSPGRDEIMSDIYDATPRLQSPAITAQEPVPMRAANEVLFDFATYAPSKPASGDRATVDREADQHTAVASTTARSTTLDGELAADEYMTAGQDDRTPADVYAAIQAWAQNSSAATTAAAAAAAAATTTSGNSDDHNTSFYSPLPSTPLAPVSEPEIISDGQLTPTGSSSFSAAGSGVDVANEAVSVAGDAGNNTDLDVMSDTDGGIPTPGSWSEVGSVISESESVMRA